MATHNSPRPKHASLHQTKSFNCFESVLGTRRSKPAHRRKVPFYFLVTPDEGNANSLSHSSRTPFTPSFRSLTRRLKGAFFTANFATTTMSIPAKRPTFNSLRAARQRLFTWFLSAWQPSALAVAIPTAPVPGRQITLTSFEDRTLPLEKISSNRFLGGPPFFIENSPWGWPGYAEMRLRPRRRRRFNTF